MRPGQVCAHALVTKYQKRISALLLDRIDFHIEAPRVDYDTFIVLILAIRVFGQFDKLI